MEELTNQQICEILYEYLLKECVHKWEYDADKPSIDSFYCPKCERYDMYPLPTHIKNYTGDMGDAWIVVEALRQKGWLANVKDMPDGFPFTIQIDLHVEPKKINRRACAVFIWMRRDTPEDTRKFIHSKTFSVADHPAKAICLAALKVLEFELGKEFWKKEVKNAENTAN